MIKSTKKATTYKLESDKEIWPIKLSNGVEVYLGLVSDKGMMYDTLMCYPLDGRQILVPEYLDDKFKETIELLDKETK